MTDIFSTYIREQVPQLSEQQVEMILSAARKRRVRKKESVLRAGEICRIKIFILEGLFRSYGVDERGGEHIMQFSPAGTWTTDGESYNNGTPASYTIEALEDSEILVWTRDTFITLLDQVPPLRDFSERLIFHNLNASRTRIYTSISATPEEKYDHFLRTFPGILQRVPLRMVAAYLGLSLKTLTRIRQAQLQR